MKISKIDLRIMRNDTRFQFFSDFRDAVAKCGGAVNRARPLSKTPYHKWHKPTRTVFPSFKFSLIAMSLFSAAIYCHAYTGNYCNEAKTVCYQIKQGNKVDLSLTFAINSVKEKHLFLGTYTKADNSFSIVMKEAANKNSFMASIKKIREVNLENRIVTLCALGSFNSKKKRYPLTPQGLAQCKKDAYQDDEFKFWILGSIETEKYSEELFKKEIGDNFSDKFILIGNSLHKLSDDCKANETYTKEGFKASVAFDESKQFCISGVPYDKCDGKTYNPEKQKCEKDIVLEKCTDDWYNKAEQYCSKGIVKDKELTDSRDGKKYKITKIGNQTWMGENLNYHGKDGYLGLCYGDNLKRKIRKPENCEKYGRLYDYAEAMNMNIELTEEESEEMDRGYIDMDEIIYRRGGNITMHQGVCPAGWYLPSKDDWEILLKFVGGIEKLQAVPNDQVESKCKYQKQDNRGRPIEIDNCIKDEFDFSGLSKVSAQTKTFDAFAAMNRMLAGDTKGDGYDGDRWWSTTYRVSHGYRNDERELSVRCLKETEEKKAEAAKANAAKEAAKMAKEKERLMSEKLAKTSYRDPDGYEYQLTSLGEQIWMAKDLVYNAKGSRSNYNNCDICDRVYDWNTAKQICKKGWHLPSLSEWNKAITYAKKKKDDIFLEFNMSGYYETARNSFSVGRRWWTSDEDGKFGSAIFLDDENNHISRVKIDKSLGSSVRCVMDD